MPVPHHTPPPGPRPSRRPGRALAACALALAVVAAGGTTAQASAAHATRPEHPASGSYIVTMRAQPAATYDGSLHGFERTRVEPGARLDAQSDAVRRYAGSLRDTHREVAGSVGATIAHDFSVTADGFSAALTGDQVERLAARSDVLAVEPARILHPTSTPASRFLGLEGDHGVWAAAGGPAGAGAGTVIGDIDTGIAPDNPSFAGKPLGTSPGDDPWRDGSGIAFRKGDGTVFHGTCETGDGFTADDCSTKVVGARSYVSGWEAGGNARDPKDPRSPRDVAGHGTHTASTAAGDVDVPATVGGRVLDTISGVAPAARIAAYKVCWNGMDPSVETDDGCATSDIDAAIEQATVDGVDVINMSLGGTGDAESTQRALLGAASAGVFVAASAGNAGPDEGSVGNAEPWITTVAASTVPGNYSATLALGDGRQLAGASVSVASPVSGPLVLGSASGVAGAKDPALCGAGTLDPEKVRGRIVECDRGSSARVDKSAEVARAGGIGMVLVNRQPDSQDLDLHTVPTVHLDADARDAVLAYAATAGASATLTPGSAPGLRPPAPQIAGFSSRGPSVDGGSDVLKPDITAPGTGILAATADTDGRPGFATMSGTSMSSPHIAGFGLVYLGLHPHASPAEIKSAMMTTASDTLDGSGHPATDPFAQGAGHIDPARFLHPGLLYLSCDHDWAGYAAAVGLQLPAPVAPVAPSQLNLPSIAAGSLVARTTVTRTVTSQEAGTWKASVQGVPGVDVRVEPATLTFKGPGETRSFEVRMTTRPGAETGRWSTGSLTWTGSGSAGTVRSPIAVRPQELSAPDAVDGTGATADAAVTVTSGVTGRIGVTASGLARGDLVHDPATPDAPSTGSVAQGTSVEVPLEVPAGLDALVLDVAPVDGRTDMDFQLEQVAEDGSRTTVDQRLSPSTSERIIVPDAPAGSYVVTVQSGAATGGPPKAEFDLTRYDIPTTGGAGSLAVRPSELAVTAGREATFRAAWSGLAAGSSYLALLRYSGSDAATLLHVTVPPDPAAAGG
jgi:subtilisin family serine protease